MPAQRAGIACEADGAYDAKWASVFVVALARRNADSASQIDRPGRECLRLQLASRNLPVDTRAKGLRHLCIDDDVGGFQGLEAGCADIQARIPAKGRANQGKIGASFLNDQLAVLGIELNRLYASMDFSLERQLTRHVSDEVDLPGRRHQFDPGIFDGNVRYLDIGVVVASAAADILKAAKLEIPLAGVFGAEDRPLDANRAHGGHERRWPVEFDFDFARFDRGLAALVGDRNLMEFGT